MGSRSDEVLEKLALELLEPRRVTRKEISYHLKRAKRLKLYWTVLDALERAVLEAAVRAKVDEYRSKRVKSLLAKLIAKIEFHTMRGKVILFGLQKALSKASSILSGGFSRLLGWAREKLNYILYLGRSMLVVELYFSPMRDMA